MSRTSHYRKRVKPGERKFFVGSIALMFMASFALAMGLFTPAQASDPTVVDVPAIPSGVTSDDPCGPDNAYWTGIPEDADTDMFDFHFDNSDPSHLVVDISRMGYTFPDGSTTHDYGLPSDSGEVCASDPGDDTTPISAKALTDHECNSEEWHFVITQIDDTADAPDSIHVIWDNGDEADVPLDKVTGGTAHYATVANLDSTVKSATADIYTDWSGQFNLSHGPCEETQPTEIPIPEIPVEDPCGPNNAHYGDVPAGHYKVIHWKDGSISLEADDGYTFPDERSSVTFPTPEDSNEPCPIGDKTVTPAAPSATQPSCDTTVFMTVTPSSQEGVVWSPSGVTVLKPTEHVTYTASPDEGYMFPEGTQTSWSFENTFDEVCLGPPPVSPTITIDHPRPLPKPKPKHLPETGFTGTPVMGTQQGSSSSGLWFLAAGFCFLLSLGSAGSGVVIRRRRDGA